MGGTALKRKARRNKAKARVKNHRIKVQGFKPVIKTVDVEAIKEEFKKAPSKSTKAKAEKVNEGIVEKEKYLNLFDEFNEIADKNHLKCELKAYRFVKSYGPLLFHTVLDIFVSKN